MSSSWLVLNNRKEHRVWINNALGKYERCAYVGAKVTKAGPKGLVICREHSKCVDCWEIFPPNCEALRLTTWFDQVIEVDVSAAVHDGWLKDYDFLWWYHGPEHLEYSKAIATCAEMLTFSHVTIVMCCPWGVYEQKESGGNKWEAHTSWLLPEDFERLGYDVSVCVKRDNPKAGIMAWRLVH